MVRMKDKIVQRILDALSWGKSELENIIFATPESALHDPFLYTNMQVLVDKLHAFKRSQDADENRLLIIDTDYDTDGIMSACVLTAALSLFNINHRIYIPSMVDGYGLNVNAIDDMRRTFPNISCILTADNGTNANEGVDYAKRLGIEVLVTDHHLGSSELANADVIVNPNVQTDTYPFKGNAGAAVAWKAMMAYASTYKPEVVDDVYKLIVFAGIANVSDVMPILDENHFMVREAVRTLNQFQDGKPFTPIGIPGYDTPLRGLFDLINLMQYYRDEKRKKDGKKPAPLPRDEQLIGWYISPLLNAPRRVVSTPETAFKGLLHHSASVRASNIKEMMGQNELKSKLRDTSIQSVKTDELGIYSNVIDIKAPHGIAGLVAGHFVGRSQKATIVFSIPENVTPDTIISGSARSTELAPLPNIIAEVDSQSPGIIVGGGGHAQAAGYAIYYRDLAKFRSLFDIATNKIVQEVLKIAESQPVDTRPKNRMTFSFSNNTDTGNTLHWNILSDNQFAKHLMDVIEFFDMLKPFGKGFEAETEFIFLLDPFEIQNCNLNLNFWKTFKAEINGVEVLTFDIPLADKLKTRIDEGNDGIILCKCELKKNEFMGRVKPQLILSEL